MCCWGQALVWCKKTKSLTLYHLSRKVGDRKAFIYICPVHFAPQCIYKYYFILKDIYTLIYVDIFSFILWLVFILSRNLVDIGTQNPLDYVHKGLAGVHYAEQTGIMSGHILKK